jgi:outer membrane protein W
MTRIFWRAAGAVGIAALAIGFTPASAHAQITRVTSNDYRHAVGVTFGWFNARGYDSRVAGDVVLANFDYLVFEIDDFNSGTVAGEWLVGIGDYLEAGVGVGYQQATVPSVYRDLVSENGFEIVQEMKLRVVPINATARFLPIGRRGAVQPYVGGGIAIQNWRYSEYGEFVDFTDETIFNARYTADGTTVGPLLVAGLRAPVADVFLIGGEVRWTRGEGDTHPEETGLLAPKVDLGGWSFNFGFHFRF